MSDWTGPALAADLCRKLRLDGWVACQEMQLRDHDGARADVVAMARRGSGPVSIRIFEIKISRADFMADIKAGKWRKYLATGPVWFAAPAGLIDVKDVPAEAGLIVRVAQGWSWRRAAKSELAPAPDLMRRLVMAG